MKKILLLTLLFIFLYSTENVKSQVIYSNNNVEVIKLADKVFKIKETVISKEYGTFPVNIIVLTGQDGILLIDTGVKNAADDLKDAVEKLNKEKVKFIINSHSHFDHAGGNTLLGKDALIICHKNIEKLLSKEELKVNAFEEEYTFNFNGKDIKCLAFPFGHSQGDIIVHLPASKIAYMGDIYLSESFPLIIINSGARVQTLIKNLKKAVDILPADTKIVPGHGRVATINDLKNYIDMLENTIEVVRKEMQSGKSLEQIQKEDVLKDWSDWGKFFSFFTKDTWIINIFMSYSEK